MSLPSVRWIADPIAVSAFGYGVRYYSLCFELALIAGYLLLDRQIRRGGGDHEEAGDFFAYGVVAIVVGARLGHVLFYDRSYLTDLVWMTQIWKGGLASHGALIGLALAMTLFMRRRGMPVLEGTDRLAFSGAFAAVVIRIGNLFNSEIVGKPTDGSWGMSFPRYDRFLAEPPLRHPTQIYEILLGIAVLTILIVCDRRLGKEQRPRGALTGIFLTSYFGGRFFLEFLKEPEGISNDALLNVGQLLSLPCFAIGAWVLWRSLRERQAAGWAWVEESDG